MGLWFLLVFHSLGYWIFLDVSQWIFGSVSYLSVYTSICILLACNTLDDTLNPVKSSGLERPTEREKIRELGKFAGAGYIVVA